MTSPSFLSIYSIYDSPTVDVKGRHLDTEKLFAYRAIPRSFLPRDSYAWNYRELATLLNLSESLAEGGFEPLTIRSKRNNLTTELP